MNMVWDMESKLDEIADGKLNWVQLLRDFYNPFIESVETAKEKLESYKGITDEETDLTCEKCGRMMVKKLGKYGYFLACSGFPECRNTMPLPYGKCPREGCGGFVVERNTKRKRSFYGCSNYNHETLKCDFKLWQKPIPEPCPACGAKFLVMGGTRAKPMIACADKECGYKRPAGEPAPGAAKAADGASAEQSAQL